MEEKERSALLSCGLFSGIGAAQAEALLKCLGGETVHCEKNAVLWSAGQRVSRCAVVLSGMVRAETVRTDGTRTLVACHSAGGLVGDILMASPESVSPVYVIAAEPSEILLIPFSAMMGGCPKCCPAHERLRENLVQEIARKYWAQRRRLGYLAVGSLRGRIAAFLLDRSSGGAFSLGMSREDMADYLCVNRSALSRELSRMKRDGLIDCYRDTFRILKREGLEQPGNELSCRKCQEGK